MTRGFLAVLLCTALLSGCTSTNPDRCTSHHAVVAQADTRAGLMVELRKQVDRRVRILRITDAQPGRFRVDVLDRRHRLMTYFDVRRLQDGSWTASEWLNCS